MASVSVKDVQVLNKRIESINQERTKVETRSQMLREQINKDIASYMEQFGVDLSASTFSEISKLIKDEARKVASEVSAEYELKEKVVRCIESGDIDGANMLLGIKEEVEEVPNIEETAEVKEVEEEDDSLTIEDEPEVVEEVSKDDMDLSVDDVDTGMTSAESAVKSMGMEMVMEDDEDDDDVDPFGFGEMLSGGKF